MSNIKLLDNEFLLLKEDSGLASPISVIFYEYYSEVSELEERLSKKKLDIQCIISNENSPFGSSQSPELWDYADDVDTVSFLLKLS